jgi:KaiC/GvpD/RAD55 family RecA-like ATPase
VGVVDWQKMPCLNWPIPWCQELVGHGVPLNHATTIVGRRGLHKTVFAFQFILDGLENGESTMIVSFRENPDEVVATLEAIAGRSLTKPERRDLAIIYQRPGYVTPEEFFHRIITAIGTHSPTRAVVNSIYPWESAYPLLQQSDVLLPAMADFFRAHSVTSLFVASGTTWDIRNLPGLLAASEVVLAFEYRLVPWGWVKGTDTRPSDGPLADGFPEKMLLKEAKPGFVECPKVVVRADRVRRASPGLTRAVLEYQSGAHAQLGVPSGSPSSSPALTMIALAPEFPLGQMIE